MTYSELTQFEQLYETLQNKYLQGVAEISDREYGKWTKALKLLNPESMLLAKEGEGELKKGTENFAYTLQKFYSLKEILNLAEKFNFPIWQLQPKIDGVSLILEYENGTLIHMYTRNDGKFKEIKLFEHTDIPPTIQEFTGMIRGELFITTQAFNRVKQKYTHQRNAVVGLMKQNTYDILNFLAYDLNSELAPKEKMKFLSDSGFKTVKTLKLESEFLQQEAFGGFDDKVTKFIDLQKESGVPVDGVVILSDSEILPQNGYVSRNRVAYKQVIKTYEVEVEEVETIPNGTRVTTMIRFKPVQFGGSTVTSAVVKKDNYRKGQIVTLSFVPGHTRPLIINH